MTCQCFCFQPDNMFALKCQWLLLLSLKSILLSFAICLSVSLTVLSKYLLYSPRDFSFLAKSIYYNKFIVILFVPTVNESDLDTFQTHVHKLASRAFVSRKRFSACWGNSPIPLERCLWHRAVHPFRML